MIWNGIVQSIKDEKKMMIVLNKFEVQWIVENITLKAKHVTIKILEENHLYY